MKDLQKAPAKGFRIWIGSVCSSRAGASWAFNPFYIDPDDSGFGRPATVRNSCISTQIVGRLLIHIQRSAIESLSEPPYHRNAARCLRRIWPAASCSLKWPPPEMLAEIVDYVESHYISRLISIGQKALAAKIGMPLEYD